MPSLVSPRLLFLVGETIHLKKLSRGSSSALCQRSVRFFSRVDRDKNAPLTLANLGFNTEFETTTKNKRNKLENVKVNYPIEAPKSREKVATSNKSRAVRVKKTLEIESAPFAAKSFSELGLPPPLIERLEREGFNVPTDVQSAAIPTILKNHDAVIQSYTGSGKTLAYVLPILSEVGPLKNNYSSADKETGKKTEIEAVIVAPSRELAMQIVREVEKLLGPENKRVVQQLVGVDELLSFNFHQDIHRILEHVGRRSGADPQGQKNSLVRWVDRRTIMVSATVPFSVVRAARSWACDPLLVQAKSVIPLESLAPGTVNLSRPSSSSNSDSNLQHQATVQSLPPALKHYYCVTRLQHKVDTLRRCVHALNAQSVIAFMNHTRQLKDAVFKLEARGMKASELHGDLGKLDSIHYAHRAGRTGRLGRKGTVVTICEEREVFVVKKLQKQLGVPIPACDFTEGKLVVTDKEEKHAEALR
ncbi:hypothetical protein D5086_006955 [Populus alba]|uniref:Uncharacterized protein n=1 Tax=Populus alba TaxID=43335 RepID=A0ACC4CNI1_POPAL